MLTPKQPVKRTETIDEWGRGGGGGKVIFVTRD